MRVRSVVILHLLASLACGGGGGGSGGGGGGGNGDAPAAGWTVLVYMMADNNLEPFAIENLSQMAAVGSGGGLNLVVQVDRAGQYSHEPIGDIPAPTSSSVKRLLVQKDGFRIVSEPGDVDTGNPASLADFIGWGVKAYPARRYALVLWDHGGAWLGGFGQDTSHGNHGLSVAALSQGIASGLQQAGLARFAFVGFDACLMASFEVAEGLKGKADYLLASEELEPGQGWDYRAFAAVQQNADVDPATLAKGLADGYHALNAGVAALTLSLVDLNQLSTLESALAAVHAQLEPQVAAQAAAIGKGRSQVLEFGRQSDPASSMNQVDLGDLWARLAGAGQPWAAARQQIVAGLGSAVVYQVRGQATAAATGLTVYFPPTQAVYQQQNRKQLYESLAGMGDWREFLVAYLGSASAVGTPAFAGHGATVSGSAGNWIVTGQLAPGASASITSATLHYGFYLPASAQWSEHLEIYGDQTARFDQASVTGAWDGSVLRLRQGTTSTLGYLSLRDLGGGFGEAVIPLAYFTAGTSDCASAPIALWQLVFDGSGLLSDEYYLFQNETVGELQPAPGSSFEALYVNLDFATGTAALECSAPRLDATAGIAIDFFTPTAAQLQQLEALLFARLAVSNPAGDGDYALALWSP